jgi:hypothetical protein
VALKTTTLAHRDAVWGRRQAPYLTELGEWDEALLLEELRGLMTTADKRRNLT